MNKLVIVCSLAMSLMACGQNKKGKVVGITDGDTVKLLTENNEVIKCRLAEIDAPERKQNFGRESKEFLSDLLYQKEIEYTVVSKDGYGRSLTKIYVGGKYVSLTLIEKGLAWHYIKYSSSKELMQAQDVARNKRVGLWVDLNALAPWEYRIKTKKK